MEKILIEIIEILFILREHKIKDILTFKRKLFKKVLIVNYYFYRSFSKIQFTENAIDWAMKNPDYNFASLSPKIKENFTNVEIYEYLININNFINLVKKSLIKIINIYFTFIEKDIENLSLYNEKFMIKLRNIPLDYYALDFAKENPNYDFTSLSSRIKERLSNKEIYNYLNKIDEIVSKELRLKLLVDWLLYFDDDKFHNLSANPKTVEAFYNYFKEDENRNNLCQAAKEAITHPKYNFNALYPMPKKRFTNKEIYKFLCTVSEICCVMTKRPSRIPPKKMSDFP